MSGPAPQPACYVTLPSRGSITVGGPDAAKFLQGLISNDLDRLAAAPALYACLLTPQGKFLFDFFITRLGDGFLLDCEGGARAQSLYKRLLMYKLRAKVSVSVLEDSPVYAVLGAAGDGFPDPRHAALGTRTGVRPAFTETSFAVWDDLRIRLGIADGSRDAEPEKSTLEELNLAATAVSFDKGCYVGQELTARMEHRGLGKRHLAPVSFRPPAPSPGSDILVGDKIIGTMRSSCGRVGLALLRDDALDLIRESHDQSPLHLLGQ